MTNAETLLCACRKAVLALAHAARANPLYESDYRSLDAVIRAATDDKGNLKPEANDPTYTRSEVDELRDMINAKDAEIVRLNGVLGRMREAIEDASDEWARNVEVDTNRLPLTLHMLHAFDAVAKQERQ
ncbi:hypothetical protein ACDA63_07320 [Uliginosibacterium sp. sgz301328]|uniref:hypothetical protein n=1 Tax=Uliginosibacterium sp. sgz301328 TaxID=3243764 RepID=UPI00359CEC7E